MSFALFCMSMLKLHLPRLLDLLFNHSHSIFSKESKRWLAGATSAANSVVSGTGVSGSIVAFTTYTVTVTAKDASGTNIGHGGDIFVIEINNQWTLDAWGSCLVNSGAKSTISSFISATMTDNGDGTYSYSYSVQNDGAITVLVKLLVNGLVNWAWYDNMSFSGSAGL